MIRVAPCIRVYFGGRFERHTASLGADRSDQNRIIIGIFQPNRWNVESALYFSHLPIAQDTGSHRVFNDLRQCDCC